MRCGVGGRVDELHRAAHDAGGHHLEQGAVVLETDGGAEEGDVVLAGVEFHWRLHRYLEHESAVGRVVPPDELTIDESVELMPRRVHVQLVAPFSLVLKAALSQFTFQFMHACFNIKIVRT